MRDYDDATFPHHDGQVDDDAADERVAVGGPVSGGRYANVTSGSSLRCGGKSRLRDSLKDRS